MSKIAEQKALEAYPLPKEESKSTSFINQETFNSSKRTGYIKGYDAAIQEIESLPKIKGTITGKYLWLDDEEITEVITKAFGEKHQPIEIELVIKVKQ